MRAKVDAFARSHKLFNKVADRMIPLIESGMSLKEAYDCAAIVWRERGQRVRK